MTNKSKVKDKWVVAGKLLAADSSASVPCPVCEQVNLIVTDIAIEGTNKFERVMSCPRCGARNILLMTKKD